MTLALGTQRIESERLVLRRMTSDDYDFFARIHAMPHNVRSSRLAERCGLQPDGQVAFPEAVLNQYVWPVRLT
jgi:hypothetical protein